jgi:hypothetical protein
MIPTPYFCDGKCVMTSSLHFFMKRSVQGLRSPKVRRGANIARPVPFPQPTQSPRFPRVQRPKDVSPPLGSITPTPSFPSIPLTKAPSPCLAAGPDRSSEKPLPRLRPVAQPASAVQQTGAPPGLPPLQSSFSAMLDFSKAQ